jgi:hypothetical protein
MRSFMGANTQGCIAAGAKRSQQRQLWLNKPGVGETIPAATLHFAYGTVWRVGVENRKRIEFWLVIGWLDRPVQGQCPPQAHFQKAVPPCRRTSCMHDIFAW